MKHLRILPLIATLAVSALAGTASAAIPNDLPRPGDPQFLVPAGKVEHTVTVVEVTGKKALPSHERTERWLSRTHARTVITDVDSGKVLREITSRPGESRVYDREKNTVRVLRDPKLTTPPWNAASFEAAVQKAYVEQGYVKVIGERVVAGRKALVVQNQAPKWRSDNPNSKTIAVVDAETYHLYQRTTNDGDRFKQDEVHQVTELLDQSSKVQARMAMAKHKGAKIVRKVKR
jgi:hypothetical protein